MIFHQYSFSIVQVVSNFFKSPFYNTRCYEWNVNQKDMLREIRAGLFFHCPYCQEKNKENLIIVSRWKWTPHAQMLVSMQIMPMMCWKLVHSEKLTFRILMLFYSLLHPLPPNNPFVISITLCHSRPPWPANWQWNGRIWQQPLAWSRCCQQICPHSIAELEACTAHFILKTQSISILIMTEIGTSVAT